jgi:hypothetical protein
MFNFNQNPGNRANTEVYYVRVIFSKGFKLTDKGEKWHQVAQI